MKKLFKLFALAIVLVSFTATTFAQVSATATATATILTPIAITKDVNMNFGNLAVNATLGTVALSAAVTPVRDPLGGVTLMSGGTVTAAKFTITGLLSATYSISLPLSATTLSLASAPDMTVDSWTSSPTPTGTLDGTGSQTLYVGGTLHVAASQPAGVYLSATPFTVTVNYN